MRNVSPDAHRVVIIMIFVFPLLRGEGRSAGPIMNKQRHNH
ncbi:hypothetical protein ACVWZ4_000729 [Bradyrhizobium sp. USDA 4472]